MKKSTQLKRIIALLFVAILTLTLFAGCKKEETPTTQPESETNNNDRDNNTDRRRNYS
jgi:hypothetical protein